MSNTKDLQKKYKIKDGKPKKYDSVEDMPEKTQKELVNAFGSPKDKNGNIIPAGENARVLGNIMLFTELPKVDLQNPVEVSDRTAAYFSICVENDLKPSVSSYALALGVSRQAIAQIKCGRKKVPRSVFETIERASSLMDALMEGYMLDGKINPVSGIFLMKNNHGYSNDGDKQKEIDPDANMERTKDEIKEKYKHLID